MSNKLSSSLKEAFKEAFTAGARNSLRTRARGAIARSAAKLQGLQWDRLGCDEVR